MVKNIVDNIKKTEEELKKKEKLAIKKKEDLIIATKEQIARLKKDAKDDNGTRRNELMASIDRDNDKLLQEAISQGQKDADILKKKVEEKKDKVIQEVISVII